MKAVLAMLGGFVVSSSAFSVFVVSRWLSGCISLPAYFRRSYWFWTCIIPLPRIRECVAGSSDFSCISGILWCTIHTMTSRSVTSSGHQRPISADDYPVLAVLNLAPAHGYDVWRYLKDKLGRVWRLGRSKVYAQLARMEQDALIYHKRVEQSNLPARKVFHLTARGRKALDDWVNHPVGQVRDFRLEFPVKLHFARTISTEAATRLIREQKAVFLEKRRHMESGIAQCAAEIERQVLGYRIKVIDAAVAWLDGLLDEQ
jgi:DNA-binding PadR family transcriptional regulator